MAAEQPPSWAAGMEARIIEANKQELATIRDKLSVCEARLSEVELTHGPLGNDAASLSRDMEALSIMCEAPAVVAPTVVTGRQECALLCSLLKTWFLVGPGLVLVLVEVIQLVIYCVWQHLEITSLLIVVGIPAYISFVVHLALFQLPGKSLATWLPACCGVAPLSLILYIAIIDLYYIIAERSFLPQHGAAAYAKGMVVMSIPYYLGLVLLLSVRKVEMVGLSEKTRRAIAWDDSNNNCCQNCLRACAGSSLRITLRKGRSPYRKYHMLFIPCLLVGVFLPLMFIGPLRVRARVAENVESITSTISDAYGDEIFAKSVGDWEFTGGHEGTLYNQFRWLRVPDENPECQKHLGNVGHPLGNKGLLCFAGLPTAGPSAKNVDAGMRFPLDLLAQDLQPDSEGLAGAFFIVVSEVGPAVKEGDPHFHHVLRFFPVMYDARKYNWNEDYTKELLTKEDWAAKAQKLEFHPTSSFAQIFLFLYLEDFPNMILDLFHGALHECYCFGMIGYGEDQKLTIQRYNRWSWDVGPGWTATQKSVTPSELKENRQKLIER